VTQNHEKNSSKLDPFNQEHAQKVAAEILLKMEENPGMTLKQATGVSDEVLEEIYSLAYGFYNQSKYSESIALFQFLASASPDTYKFVLGLAASYHQIQQYKRAATSFYIALRIEPNNPTPAYYMMDCFLKQNLVEEAEESAEITAMICGDRPEYSAVKERCELILKKLKENK
jgi:type III secretion system low calcium response chaperone LcrH/SycD